MFPLNLTTNEVKNSAGTEVEFIRQSAEGRQLVFAFSGEAPNRPHRITVSHSETGSGVTMRRRSLLRVDKTVTGVDTNPTKVSAYAVSDVPVGNLADVTEVKNVLAELVSMLASQGANTTILFDCTGYGATALSDGSL